jgi:sialate O-acetylesterase
VITVRVLHHGDNRGFTGDPGQMTFDTIGEPAPAAHPPITVAGEWRYRTTTALADLPPMPQPFTPGNANLTAVLANGMIAPLMPAAIRGAIWYQGESNVAWPARYRRLLPALIADWRAGFAGGDFPFLIVQLAGFMPPRPTPQPSPWAALRAAQAAVAREVPGCGLASAIDIGEAGDIHPKNKQEVGRRLALTALAQVYGRKVEASGPVLRSATVEGGRIRLAFDHADGLTAAGGTPTGFALAGTDRRWVWAEAVIDGGEVEVTSPQVTAPVAVRYAWSDDGTGNLRNSAGLPMLPFSHGE